VAEYFFFGEQRDYSVQGVIDKPALAQRLSRGVYTLGRHYMATSMLLEVTPCSLTPNVFIQFRWLCSVD
jgi:hypothetical protein